MDNSETTQLPYDDDGFLVGIKQINNKFSDIEKDIAEILSILRNTKFFDYVPDTKNKKSKSSIDGTEKVINALDLLNEKIDETNKIIGDSPKSTPNADGRTITDKKRVSSTAQENENVESFERRERDSKGRFTGKNGDTGNDDSQDQDDKENKGYIKSIIGKLGQGVSLLSHAMPDTHGVDPTVDAVHELNESLSPVKRMAGAIFRPLSGIMKSKKRSEPIPREQARHNSRVLSILGQIGRQSGNSLSLFGLMRVVPMMALAIGSAVTLGLIAWWKGDKVGSVREGKVNGQVASAGLAKIEPTKSQRDNIKDSYDSARNAGFSHEQAIALVGENGRENGFRENLMYGSHDDPARGKNLGIFSWQGKRREGLIKYLSSKGLMNQDGTIVRSKEGLQAQYEYARMEMEGNSKWKQTFLDNKTIGNDEARQALGGAGSYVGWARGQDTIRKADGTRVAFDWKKQEATANGYSKLASAIVDKNAETDDKTTQSEVKTPKATSRNPIANKIQNEAYEKDQSTNTIKTPTATPMTAKSSDVAQTTSPKSTNPSTRQAFYQGVSKLPTSEKAVEKVSSSSPKPVIISNNDGSTPLIGQNVGDVNLANIFSGGIGMERNLFK